MKEISSRDNAGFKALRELATDHREPRRQGRTLADGIHLVATCFERGAKVQQLLLSESGRRHPEIVDLLYRAGDIDTLVLRDSLFRELSGVAAPTGIAAVIAIPDNDRGAVNGDAVLLDAVQDAGNVGTILRSAAAAGVRDVLLGPGCAGAWTPRVLRAGQGAHFSLRIREQVDLGVLLETYGGTSIAAVARDGENLYRLDLGGPVAWLFGNEGAGLAPALEAAATRRATIPMAAATESLNVAAAAAVCLFEAARQRAPAAR